jgi:protein phosphatase
VRHANAAIFKKSQSDANLAGMGTTCTLIHVADGEARLAHVGDSRAYILRDGKLTQLTDDHTLVNRMVKEGRLRPEDAERHPQRSIITRALGIDENVKVDYRTLSLKPGDRLLLCSDGLSSMIDARVIQGVLSETADPDDAAETLVQRANEAGGEDNITVVVVDFSNPGNGSAAGPAVKRVAREPVRIDTSAPPGLEPVRMARAPRRWPKKLLAWVAVLVALGVAGFLIANYFLDRAWFVGVNDDGFVAVYQGIPEEVAGLDLKDEIETTTVALTDLPQFLRPNLAEGIKYDSEEEARDQVVQLKERAEALRQNEDGDEPRREGNQQDKKKRREG